MSKSKQEVMDEAKVLLLELHDLLEANKKVIANAAIDQTTVSMLTKWFNGVNDKRTVNPLAQQSAKRQFKTIVHAPKNTGVVKKNPRVVAEVESTPIDIDNPLGLTGE